MALRTVHVKMRTEEISAIDLLAEKDRRRPAELLRFAVEEYCERRASEVVALKKKKVAALVRGERSSLSRDEAHTVRDSVRLSGPLKGDEFPTKEELLHRIQKL